MMASLPAVLVSSSLKFNFPIDLLRKQIVNCSPEEIRSAAELPIWLAQRQADSDVKTVIEHLGRLEQSDCTPLAILAGIEIYRKISELQEPENWTALFHETVELSPEQTRFSRETLPAMNLRIVRSIEFLQPHGITIASVLENVMKAIVSTKSSGMVTELLMVREASSSRMYNDALAIAEIAGITQTENLLKVLISQRYSPLSSTVPRSFAGAIGINVEAVTELMSHDEEFRGFFGLGMLDEAKERLRLTLEQNGMDARHIVESFHPELLNFFRIPHELKTIAQPRLETLLALADTGTKRLISSLHTTKTDDANDLNLFLHHFAVSTQDPSISDQIEEFLLAQPDLAMTAMSLRYPNVKEPETLLNFRTIRPFLTGKKRQTGLSRNGLRHPTVFENVLDGSEFVRGLLDFIGTAELVEKNRNRCLGDLFPLSVLMQYDEFFFERNPNYSLAWHLTTS